MRKNRGKMTHSTEQVLSTKYQRLNTKTTSTKYLSSIDIKERSLYLAGELANEQFTAWYCKAFKAIGEQRFTKAVHEAKTGKNPKTLFGYLLKEEMKARS